MKETCTSLKAIPSYHAQVYRISVSVRPSPDANIRTSNRLYNPIDITTFSNLECRCEFHSKSLS